MSKPDPMTPAEETVLKAAVQFIQGDRAQQDLHDLREAPGPSAPLEFLSLADAVSKLPEAVKKRYARK